jgi:hypothetical protein
MKKDWKPFSHRILQLKKQVWRQSIILETQKLYEKLSVLRFVNEHYGATKPTITHAEIEKSKIFMIKVVICLLQP